MRLENYVNDSFNLKEKNLAFNFVSQLGIKFYNFRKTSLI